MKGIYISFFLAITLISCSKYGNGEYREYYENGNIKALYYLKDSLQHGKRIEYYENGVISSIATWENGKQTGQTIYFFPSGNISNIEKLENGISAGTSVSFYENGDLSVASQKFDTINVSLSNYCDNLNSRIWLSFYNIHDLNLLEPFFSFDRNFNLLKLGSSFYSVDCKYDTISVNKKAFFDIYFDGMRLPEDRFYAVFGNYDKYHNLLDSLNLDTVYETNNKIRYYFSAKDTGKIVVRGLIYCDFKIKEKAFTRKYNFTKEFEVVE